MADDRVLEVGTNGRREVVVNHPNLDVDDQGRGFIIFSPEQARNLAQLLMLKAAEAEME